MAKVAITLYEREYFVNCDPGEERRLEEIVRFLESKMHKIISKVGNVTEARLFMLTCLTLADELMDTKHNMHDLIKRDEEMLLTTVDHLRGRVEKISTQVGRA